MGSTAIIYAAVAVGIALACLLIGRVWGRSNVRSQVEDAVEVARKSSDAREFTLREQLDQKMTEVAKLTPLVEELNRLRTQIKNPQFAQSAARFDNASTLASVEASAEAEIAHIPEEPVRPVESADETIQKLMQSLEATLQEPTVPETPVQEPETQAPAVAEQAPKKEPTFQAVPISRPIPEFWTAAPARSIAASQPAAPPRPASVPQSAPQPRPAAAASRPAPPAPSAPHQPNAAPRPAPAVPTPVPRQPAVQPRPAAQQPADASRTAASPRQPTPAKDEWQEFARSLDALTGRKK